MEKTCPGIEFHKGLPTDFNNDTGRHWLMILDDLQYEISKSPEVSNAFTRNCHHNLVSLIFICQNFYYKNIRTITTNCKYLCIFKNPRDSAAITHLSRQCNGGKRNKLMENAYAECMTKPYGYIVIDLSQSQDDRYRLRDSLFPEETTILTDYE
jgi:hypothetical protein